jgi:hypothetical protein
MHSESVHDQPTSGQENPAMAPVVDLGYVPPPSPGNAEDYTTVPVPEVHDIVREDQEDLVESAQDAVEDIQSESPGVNQFRV